MARMSIDDKFPRDPRVTRLGKVFGWSRRETMGALLDVYQIAYDRELDVLPQADIDTAAEREGFTAAMIEVGLAEIVRAGVRIKGAKKRIKYLVDKVDSGKAGGVKSGESRRNKREAKKSSASGGHEATGNPPDPVPDVAGVPDVALVPDQIPDLTRYARVIPPTPVDGGEPGTRQPRPRATQQGAATPGQSASSAAGNVAEPYIDPTPDRVESPPSTGGYDPGDGQSRARLAEHAYTRIGTARAELAAELGLPPPLALPLWGPTCGIGMTDALARIREEGATAPAAVEHVIAVLTAQARADRDLEFLGTKAFTSGGWRHARERIPGATPSARRARASPRAEPVRDIRFGAVQPSDPSCYPDGEIPI